jgi:mRNA turnover protein 4
MLHLQFAFSQEVTLRKLGLPVKLTNGEVELLADTDICSEGDTLTPEQCTLLQLFEQEMATFKMNIVCMWAKKKVTHFDAKK